MRTFFIHLLCPALLCLGALGCSPTDGWYEDCDSSSACVGSTVCVRVAFEEGRTGRMCSAQCERHADCPFGGACYELVGDPQPGLRYCYARCVDELDCAPGFTCADAQMGDTTVDGICLPL